jgi:hypothetical protein
MPAKTSAQETALGISALARRERELQAAAAYPMRECLFTLFYSMVVMYLVVLVFGLALHLIERNDEEGRHTNYLRAIAAANLTDFHIQRLVQFGMPDPTCTYVDDWGTYVSATMVVSTCTRTGIHESP